ncbi:MAG: phage tail tape measure protein [Deferribacterales bacterium]
MVGKSMVLNSVFSLTDMISGPLKRIQSSMNNTERAGNSLTAKMMKLTKSFALVAAAAGVIVGSMWSLASSTIETQSRLGELASVGITNMAALETAATDFSNNFAGSTKADFLAAAYDIKSGISSLSDEGVAEFTALAGATAKATKATIGEMTSLFATGYGIYKGQYAQMSDIEFGSLFSSGIAASVQGFKTTGAEMSAAITSIGAAATNAQVPLQEQLSVLGMLQATMSGSEAGTKYRAFIAKAAGAGKDLGLSFMDANNTLRSMPEILTALKSKYGETIDAVEKMQLTKAFGTEEAVALIDLLYSKVGDLQTNIGSLDSAMKSGKAFTLDMAKAMNDHLGANIQKAGQQVHNLAEIVGGIFAPMFNTVVNGFSGVAMWLQKVATAVASSSIGRGFLNIALVASLAVVGLFAFSAATAAASFAMPMLTAALAPVVAMIGAISWPIWLAVGAVIGLYIAFKKNFGGMADSVKGWWNNISLTFRGVTAIFRSLEDGVGTIKGELATDIKAAGLVNAVTTIAKIVYRIKELFAGIYEPIAATFASLAPVFSDAFGPLWSLLKGVGSMIGWVAEKLGLMTAGTDVSGWRTFGNVIGMVMSGVVQLIMLPIHAISILMNASKALAAAPMAVVDAFLNMIASVKNFFANLNLAESGAKMVTTLVDGIKSKIMAPVEAVKGGFMKLRNLLPFSDAKEGPLSQLTKSGSKIMSTLAVGVVAESPVLSAAMEKGFNSLPGVSQAMPAEAQHLEMPASVPTPGEQQINLKQEKSDKSAKGGLTVTIQQLNLPGVTDVNDFIAALQAMVVENA